MQTLPDVQEVIESNPEWELAWHLLHKDNISVNLTGKAGTGKSTFIRAVAKFSGKKVLFTAPTGLAALNIRGVTLHSLFGLPFGPILANDPRLLNHKLSATKRKILEKAELLVIDEVSMVRADVLDAIDFLLKRYCHSEQPFGGKQMLLVGDNFQLEPVTKKEEWELLAEAYSHPYYFASEAFKAFECECVELKTVYRQTDDYFISLLNKFRIGSANPSDLDELNSRVVGKLPVVDDEHFRIILATRTAVVASENLLKLAQLKTERHVFKAIIKDRFNQTVYPTEEMLELKVDAQVIMVRNDKTKRWVNGSLGKVKAIVDNELKVLLENGKTVKVNRETWEQIEYKYDAKTKKLEEEVVGTFTQFPVRLAWAITIHKSQGLTFNRVVLNMEGGAFAAGQLYVALSRCRTFEGLILLQAIKPSDIIVKREALEYAGLGKYIDESYSEY